MISMIWLFTFGCNNYFVLGSIKASWYISLRPHRAILVDLLNVQEEIQLISADKRDALNEVDGTAYGARHLYVDVDMNVTLYGAGEGLVHLAMANVRMLTLWVIAPK